MGLVGGQRDRRADHDRLGRHGGGGVGDRDPAGGDTVRCNGCYNSYVTRWLVVVIRLPANPSKHRVAVWRELRRVGAIPLGGGVWALPAAPVFAAGLQRVTDLVTRADGQMLAFDSRLRGEPDETAL